MVYICMKKDCGFVFERVGDWPDHCPACGGSCIREANEGELTAYLAQKKPQAVAPDGTAGG